LPIDDPAWIKVADGFNFPEGPAWDNDGTLYLSNCYGDWLPKIQNGKIDTLVTASDSTINKTNGLLVLKNGDLLACDFGFGSILRISKSGKVVTLINGYAGARFNRPNDLTIDSEGKLWFSDPKSYGTDKLDGRLFRYDFETEQLDLVRDSLAFPNGLAFSPTDKRLYLSESAKNRILRFKVSAQGQLTDQKTFIELQGGDPDGLDFDQTGNLYVAHFGSGLLFIIAADGSVLQKINTPGKKPSNIEFGGEDLKTLYLTEDETNALYKVQTRYAGYKF